MAGGKIKAWPYHLSPITRHGISLCLSFSNHISDHSTHAPTSSQISNSLFAICQHPFSLFRKVLSLVFICQKSVMSSAALLETVKKLTTES